MRTSTDGDGGGRPLAVVTGASSGIGRALARELTGQGFDLAIVADDELVGDAAGELAAAGSLVLSERRDLSRPEEVVAFHDRVTRLGRPVALAALNAGTAVAGPFVGTPLERQLSVVDLNVRSVVHLTGLLLPAMLGRGDGRLLFTSSVAGAGPGPRQATYSASKAFEHLFAHALRHELRGTGVTVTSLRPGPTETAFFDRAGMRGTRLVSMPKDRAERVAGQAVRAALGGRAGVVSGSVLNRAQLVASGLLPDRVKAHLQAALVRPRRRG